MNILVINWRDIKHPEAGGAEVHYHELFRRIAAKGHGVSLLTTRFGNAPPVDNWDGITVYRYGHNYIFNWEAPVLIKKLLAKERFDCIVDDVNKIPFFSARWFPGMPVCAFFHHLFGKTVFGLAPFPMACYVLMLERLSAWAYRNVPCCTVSESTLQDMVSAGFRKDRISIIENSVDTDVYVPGNPGEKDERLLLYTGRLKKYKNVDIVMEAVARLTTGGRRVRLAIAGSGDDEARLRDKARELGVAGLVAFKGFVDTAEKIRLLQRAAIFVNPSRKEGWGITGIEANACGTAVVANNAPGLRDSVIHGETGLLYEENNPENLVRCIERLLDNKEERKKLELSGRKWAESFSWNNSADKVETWLRRTVNRG